jgi:hypothetical protein
MSKRLIWFAALFLVGAATLMVFMRPFSVEEDQRCSSLKFTKASGKIQSTEPFQIVYAFELKYDDVKNPDLILGELPGPWWNQHPEIHPRLRYIFNNGDGSFQEDMSFPTIKTEHVRHLLPIKIGNEKGFIFADHGDDHPPFPGSAVRIFLKKSGKWTERTGELLPKIQDFNFSLAKVNSIYPGHEDIFVGVVGNEDHQKGTYLLKNDGKDHFTFSADIPESLRDGHDCFMTVHAVASANSKSQSVFLGGCDRDQNSTWAPRDRILSRKTASPPGKWNYLPQENVPLRARDNGWGTVAVASADLNKDGFPDIVAATHNFGFTEGAIQILMNNGNSKFLSLDQGALSPGEKGKASFIPWVRIADVDGDGFADILAPIVAVFKDGKDPRLKRKFALYHSISGKKFVNESSCLNSALAYVADAHFMDLNHDGKADVLLIGSDGQFEIFYNF